jgi:hypothetical protein
MTPVATTAAEAFDLYQHAYKTDCLIQNGWHDEGDDGRKLACALGVLGDEVDGADKCPAEVMPEWLAQMVPWFFDAQPFADAKEWGLRFYAELARLKGEVPLSVGYDWWASVVCPIVIEAAEAREIDPTPWRALQALHQRAAGGDIAPEADWQDAVAAVRAWASAWASASASAWASASASAWASAWASASASAWALKVDRAVIVKRMADGMVACLERVAV